MNTYIRAANMADYVRNIPYIRGSTNTADAIKAMHETMFTTKNGDRPGIPNVGIVITDGMYKVVKLSSYLQFPWAEHVEGELCQSYIMGGQHY